jgi:hypothetical protein
MAVTIEIFNREKEKRERKTKLGIRNDLRYSESKKFKTIISICSRIIEQDETNEIE